MSFDRGKRLPAIELMRLGADPAEFLEVETDKVWRCFGLTHDLEHFICYEPLCILDSPLALDVSGCKCFPAFSPNGPLVPKLLDVFAGSGAVSHTMGILGFETIASVDIGLLACQNLRDQSKGLTICGDISDPKVVALIHDTLVASGVEGFCLAAGFPCQPFSRQGSMSGTADVRFGAFVGLIFAVRCLKPKLLLLECVTQAGESTTIKTMLHELCDSFGWVMREVCLELGQQWPMNCRRWYCVMSDVHNVPESLPGWGMDPCRQTVGDVLPEFLSITHPGMQELLLTSLEIECYADPRLGMDKRQLTLEDKCNTILHSYGSPLQRCTCGCRQEGFAMASLVTKGLRGCFVISPDDPRPRYLHSDELRILFALPPGMKLPEKQKDALCLIGLIAAPLQLLWVMGHVLLAASQYDDTVAPIDPSLILAEYKAKIVEQTQVTDQIPGTVITVGQSGEPSWQCRVHHEATVSELLHAERINIEWGHRVQVTGTSGAVSGFDLLLEHQADLLIDHTTKRSRIDLQAARILLQFKIQGQSRIALLPRGSMLFEFYDQISDQRPNIIVNLTGDIVPLDTRIWFPGSYAAVDGDSFPCWPLSFRLEGQGIKEAESTLLRGWYEDEVEHHSFFLLRNHGLAPEIFWTARWIVDVTEIWPHAALQLIRHKWEAGGHAEAFRCGILWEDFHWSAFVMHHERGHLFVTIFDSHRTEITAYMDLFFARVSRALSCEHYDIRLAQGIGQSGGAHCGAVAVLNISNLIDNSKRFTELDAILLHAAVLDKRSPQTHQEHQATISPTLTWQMIGTGPDIQAQLAALIQSRGVPEEAKNARAQTILQRLGVQAVTKILGDRNPWAALKSSASKPGISLRILSDGEKAQYIEMRASTKHGAQIKNHKGKKARGETAAPKEDLASKLIPSQLVLDPKMFKDGNGDHIPQLQFAQVEADQHGLAICTLGEADAFLKSPKSISPHALGLLMLEPPAAEVMQQAGAVKMRFPAQYLVTGEQVLIFGALLSIGDISIDRATAGSVSKQPVLPTAIIKYTCYRDQLPVNWQQFTEAPIREILKMFEPLNYCDGKNRGSQCHKTHPDVDKTYEAVILELWGRHFTAATGAKKTPADADQFSFQIRVPAAIVIGLVSNNPIGLYSDPRTDDFRIAHPDFSIIWLNKADFTQVEHLSRTCAFALSIARHRQRFGIRVKKNDEAKAWAELKPDQHLQAVMKIEQIYEPVPHGTQKKTMENVMKEWNWTCRVLQPGRGSHFHMSWQVGAQEEPPARVMQAFQSDVLINPIRKVEVEALKPKIIVAQKTQQHFKKVNVTNTDGQDPWLNNNDPWAQYQATSSAAAPLPAPTTTKRIDEIKGTLQQEVKEAIRKEIAASGAGEGMTDTNSGRIDHLESALQEVKSQNSALKGWIQDAQTKLQKQEAQLTQLKHEVGTQSEQMKVQFTNLQGEMNQSFEKQFSRLEALLEKRQRHE